jgi:hypothetical protein
MFYCPDITTNLKNKNCLIHEVEDWKVTIPSYDIFPTVQLTFDNQAEQQFEFNHESVGVLLILITLLL